MLHGFNPEYAGQGRGFPRLAHALQEFEQITDFSLSTIQKAISQASLVMAVENDQADSSNPLIGRVAGPVREYGSHPQPSASAANVTDEAIAPINFEYMPEATIDRPGSVGVFNLRKGDKLKYLADTSPSTSYDVFLNSFVSYLSASVGMPVEILLMKFNANYSASRAAFITFWRVAQIWRDEMAADFLDPTYEMWLAEEIAAGRVSAPGWSDPRLRAAWLCCEWAGAAMPNIDPVKTATADRAYVEMGSQTLDDVARNYNGSSGKSNRAKIKRQYEELSEPSWGWSGKREVITKKSEKDEEE
jgi:capsid protein